MQTTYKTSHGTLSATRYEDGIYFGILNQGSIGAIKPSDDGRLTLVNIRETEGWCK